MAGPSSDTILSAACLSSGECVGYLEGREEAPSAQTVQHHLDECERCRVLVAETAGATFGDGLASKAPVRTLADGEKLGGRYEIRRFIARGGMGEVYEASDLALGESVALKTLSPTMLDQSDATDRLIAEVRLARKVTHANVCRILEFGVHRRQHGATVEVIPVLTMELLEGETLASRIRRVGRVDPDQALSLLGEIAAGLAAVHAAGIVHRDFKTENVFLVRGPGGAERAVVMDFGLARTIEASRATPGSSAQSIIGTVAYMAPEQVEGRPPTPAFDIYALGIVAFELLTGQLPFIADSPLALAALRLRKEPPPPSSLRPDLPSVWDLVIGRCLARDPKRRFGSVDEVIAALERARKAKSRRRQLSRRACIALAAAACLGLGATIGAATVFRRPSHRIAAAGAAEDLSPEKAATLWLRSRERGQVPKPAPWPAAAICESPPAPVAPLPDVKLASRPRKRARSAPAAAPVAPAPGSAPTPSHHSEGVDDFIDPFPK